MAVGFDSSVESHTGTTGSTSEASYTWNHTPTTPRGILIFTYVCNTNADDNLAVTYGGVNVPRLPGGQAIDTTTEPGRCQAWFLGSDIPTGLQAIVVTRVNNADICYGVSIAVTSNALNTTVPLSSIILLQNNQALAEQSVNDGSPGTNSMRFAGIWTGLAGGAPIGANSTGLQEIILAAARACTTCRETTAGQGARSVGFTTATSDDTAAVHLAVTEVPTQLPAHLVAPPVIPVNRRL